MGHVRVRCSYLRSVGHRGLGQCANFVVGDKQRWTVVSIQYLDASASLGFAEQPATQILRRNRHHRDGGVPSRNRNYALRRAGKRDGYSPRSVGQLL